MDFNEFKKGFNTVRNSQFKDTNIGDDIISDAVKDTLDIPREMSFKEILDQANRFLDTGGVPPSPTMGAICKNAQYAKSKKDVNVVISELARHWFTDIVMIFQLCGCENIQDVGQRTVIDLLFLISKWYRG